MGRGRWLGTALVGLALASGCSSVRPPTPPAVPGPAPDGMQVGVASWYGPGFHGRRTASGEVFDQHELTAAHRTLGHGTRVMVTNLDNGRAVEVRINDRGPFIRGRVIDLSYAAARALGMIGPGTASVRLEVLVPDATYLIEVAALGDAARAEHLRDVLARHFPDTFVAPLDQGVRPYYRVRLGPYPLRAAAQARAERLGRLGYPAVIVEEAP